MWELEGEGEKALPEGYQVRGLSDLGWEGVPGGDCAGEKTKLIIITFS